MVRDPRRVIGLGVQTWGTDVAALKRYWSAADELGFTRVTYGDGLWGFTHDGWSMLGALATVTRRVRLGPAVTYAFDASSHHPSWLAKRAVTIDHLSDGRLDLRLGIGADDADTAAVWHSHGIPYPPARERVTRLDETVRIVRALWSGASVAHAGPAHALDGARLEPRPVQRPGPPVWIAAVRPAGLDLVARRGDGWEASYVTPEAYAAAWRTLQARLRHAGRSEAALGRSVELDVAPGDAARSLDAFCAARAIRRDHPLAATVLAGPPDAIAARIGEYAAAGATDLMLGFVDFPATRSLEAFAVHVRPRVEALMRSPAPR